MTGSRDTRDIMLRNKKDFKGCRVDFQQGKGVVLFVGSNDGEAPVSEWIPIGTFYFLCVMRKDTFCREFRI